MTILIGAAIILFFILVLIFNSLVGKRNDVKNALASIDVHLKQRHDLIPNLVASVKSAMTHERGTLERLVELRSQAIKSETNSPQSIEFENQITRGLKSIIIAMENYPALKANENISLLQRSLNEVEAQIAASRRAFNAAATELNNAVEMFPGNIFAGVMGINKSELFESLEIERQNPDLNKMLNS